MRLYEDGEHLYDICREHRARTSTVDVLYIVLPRLSALNAAKNLSAEKAVKINRELQLIPTDAGHGNVFSLA
jgi:hypothetical protein